MATASGAAELSWPELVAADTGAPELCDTGLRWRETAGHTPVLTLPPLDTQHCCHPLVSGLCSAQLRGGDIMVTGDTAPVPPALSHRIIGRMSPAQHFSLSSQALGKEWRLSTSVCWCVVVSMRVRDVLSSWICHSKRKNRT